MDFLHKKYDANNKVVDEYNDTIQRKTAKPIVNEYFNDNFINFGLYEIDLVSTINPTIYIELEGGSWFGDHKLSIIHCDRFDCGCETVNVPERKFPIIGLEITHPEVLDGRKNLSEKYRGRIIHFGRFNVNYDQFILIPHDVLIDPNKRIIKYDQQTSKSKILENFACYPIEYCLVFNLQPDGTWKLNGKYCGIPDTDSDKLNRVREVMKNKNR